MTAPVGGRAAARDDDTPFGDPYDAICDAGALTRRQLLVWAGDRVTAGAPVFVEAGLLHVHGRLDAVRFVAAWHAVVAESDALRSAFTDVAGLPRRAVRAWRLPIDVVDHAARPTALVEVADACVSGCSPTTGPGGRAALVRLGAEHHVWVIALHQLVSDAWSFGLVHRRVEAYYRRAGGPVELDHPDVPAFAAWVAHERRLRHSPAAAAARGHWRRCYGPPEPHGAPAAGPEGTRITRLVHRLEAGRAAAVRRLAAEAAAGDVGLFAVFASLVAAHLQRTTGVASAVLAVPFANRPSARFKETIGSFMSLCPLRVELDAGEPFARLCRRVVDATWDAARHQWYASRPGAVPHPYDVAVNVHRSAVAARTFADHPMDAEWYVPTHRFGAVTVAVHDFSASGALTVALDFQRATFGPTARAEFLSSLLRCLDRALDDPGRPLDPTVRPTRSGAEAPVGGPPAPAAAEPLAAGVEQALVAVWRDLLGVEAVGRHADFFALGGDSLLVHRLLLRVRAALGVEVETEAFLADPTVAGLASAVGSRAARAQDAGLEEALREVQNLSEEEAARLLRAASRAGDEGERADA